MPRILSARVATGVAILLVSLAVMIATDSWFTVLDDEAQIATAAWPPAIETIKLFSAGPGQHEHPPLSDVLLHFWLPFARNATLLRLPSILLYGAGLLLFATMAKQFAGDTAFFNLLVIGALWPFGFHFGRLAGWYSCTFFAVALVSLTYLYWLRRPSWNNWLLLISAAALLVFSNYFGWVILGLLAIDAILMLGVRRTFGYLLTGMVVLMAVYAPLWRVFLQELHSGLDFGASGIATRAVYAAYNFYVLFVSESVAPWYWQASVFIGLAIVVCVCCACLLLTGSRALAFLVYFAILFLFMSASGIINAKRLLFISGWLLVPLAVALARNGLPRVVLLGCLLVIAVSGVFGTVTRRYYASLHFIEPWRLVALEVVPSIHKGVSVVTNSPSFLFYLNFALTPEALPGMIEGPDIVFLDVGKTFTGFGGPVLFVRGTNVNAMKETADAEAWLNRTCTLLAKDVKLIDADYALKQRYFRHLVEGPNRIVLVHYQCP